VGTTIDPGERPVVILTVPFGSAHQKTAEAIRKSWNQAHRPAPLEIIRLEEYLPQSVVSVFVKGYLGLITHMPWLFRTIYRRAREPGAGKTTLRFARILAKPVARRLLNQIGRQPGVWLSTHPMTNSIIGAAMRIGSCREINREAMAVLVTDHHFHAFWCYPDTDMYFVGRRRIQRTLIHRDIPASKIRFTGIPVDPEFINRKSRLETENELGLPPADYRILLMGGGLGIGPIEALARSIAKLRIPVQLIVVAGQNAQLVHRLSNMPDHVIVYGYTNSIPALMSISDLCLTKPGGLTLAEAAAVGLPTLLFEALPGHEEENREILLRGGAAYCLGDLSRASDVISALIHRRSFLTRLGRRMSKSGRPHASSDVADSLEQLWRKALR